MKKRPFPRVFANIQKQWNQNLRLRERQGNNDYTRQQTASYKSARRARRASARAAYVQSVIGNAAKQRQALHETLRWTTLRRFTSRAVFVIAVGSLVCNVLMYNRWSLSRPLVTIGHRVITKGEYLAKLDTAAGKPVLTKLVFDELIRQAAEKAGVFPTEMDVDARLAEQRRQMPGSLPAEDTPDLRDHVRQVLALENLRIQGVSASDSEIAAFYAAHRMAFTRPAQARISLVVAQNPADAAEASRLLAAEMPEDAIAAHPGLRVDGVNGFHVNMNVLPPRVHVQLSQTVMGMKNGELKTVRLGDLFLTFKMKSHIPGFMLPLSQVREQVAREVKLQKAPSDAQKLADLYQANRPDFDVAKYGDYFSDLDSAPRPALPENRAKTANVAR